MCISTDQDDHLGDVIRLYVGFGGILCEDVFLNFFASVCEEIVLFFDCGFAKSNMSRQECVGREQSFWV